MVAKASARDWSTKERGGEILALPDGFLLLSGRLSFDPKRRRSEQGLLSGSAAPDQW
jgi:hypothetical protein